MISSRTYRDAVGVAQAFEELRKGSGAQFCPQCVAAAERALATGQLDDVLGLGAAA
jgi:HD-GYP domain-containing protein (c-di-GMP phosphodiesterase class II)